MFKVALSDWNGWQQSFIPVYWKGFLQVQKAYEGKYNVTVESWASTHFRVSAQEARQMPGNAHSWVSAQVCFLSFYMASALVFRQLPRESLLSLEVRFSFIIEGHKCSMLQEGTK